MHKISIIIPVYNVEQYLLQCLDSVINQTYENLEIIIVNDGSTDFCPQICDEYAAKDQRVKVIHKKNGGLSDARNVGLQIATGDFISFVDSDDLVDFKFYQVALQRLIEHDADIVECGFCRFETVLELEKCGIATHAKSEIFSAETALELLMKENLKQVVWNKVYRTEVVSNVRFPVNKINEDEYWTYRIFGNAKKIVKIPDELYFYRQQPDSIMGKKYSVKRLDGLQALEERILYMRENFPTLENLAIKVFCFGSFAHYQKICEHQKIDPQNIFKKKIINSVNNYNKLSIYRHWDLKAIFWFQLFIATPNIFVKCRKYNERRVEYFKQNVRL